METASIHSKAKLADASFQNPWLVKFRTAMRPNLWSKQLRLGFMLSLNFSMFLVEIIVGYWVGSMALITDSFHMLSDVLALAVALYAVRVVGALINGVFLLALCFMIYIEAIQRFVEPVNIEQPVLVLIVGGVGLAVNLLGLFLFHDHGHGHSHGHSHGHGHARSKSNLLPAEKDPNGIALKTMVSDSPKDAHDEHHSQDSDTPQTCNHTVSSELHQHQHHQDLNIRGVFLHVLGDALGSVAVVVSALVIWLTTSEHRFLIDPIISMVMTTLIVAGAVPLVRRSCLILLQGVPSTIPMDDIRAAIQNVDDVLDVHELHIWQLSDTKLVASVHIVVLTELSDVFMEIAQDIRSILHQFGIHSATVQPEFLDAPLATSDNPHTFKNDTSLPSPPQTTPLPQLHDDSEVMRSPTGNSCLLRCTDRSCEPQECCPSDVLVQWTDPLRRISTTDPSDVNANPKSPNAPDTKSLVVTTAVGQRNLTSTSRSSRRRKSSAARPPHHPDQTPPHSHQQ